MRRTWCWCQTLHGLLDVPDVNSLRGKGKRWVTHWFAVSFYFPSNSSKTAKILNAMKSLSTLYVKCEMQYLTVSCSAAQHRSSPANAEPVRLELRNRMQCSNVIPAVSSELISLAERQDRFCLGRLHRQSSYRAWYLSQFIWSNAEVLSVLRKLYWLKWCQITLLIRSVVSMTYAEGCI